jgi:hypothetical protein
MPHRDDHDAALARADALQAELDRERASHAEQGDRIAALERELREARNRLEKAEATLGDIKPKKPAPSPVFTDEPPPQEHDEGTAKIGLVIGVIVMGIIAALAMAKCQTAERRGDAPPLEPSEKPPFVADTLMKRGLERLGGEMLLDEIAFDYVKSDGTLDETHGRVRIETRKRRPPKPPDDPNRPTGAPDPNAHDPMMDMMMSDCPEHYWSPSGWSQQRGSCMSFGNAPVGRPGCTPASIVGRARADGAPEGLARVKVEWTYLAMPRGLEDGWKWTFSITDHARNVSFSRDYDDRDCVPPPVEK